MYYPPNLKNKTMKKQYQAPRLCAILLRPEMPITTSLKIDSTKSGGDALVKGSDDWDIWGDGQSYDDEESPI